MPVRAFRLGAVLLLLAASGVARAASPAPSLPSAVPACPGAGDYATAEAPLPALAAALRSGAPVEVLAVGSASTAAADGYPQRMLAALREARPGTEFRLTVRGARGLQADQTLALLRAALHARRAPLVLWQVGTVDAVRGLRPEALADALEAGAADVAAQGGDLVLIDPQYSRFLQANVELDPYERAIASVAARGGAVLFHRFALMRDWADAGTLDLERAAPKQRAAVAARLADCVGAALARFVLAGAGGH